MDALTCWNLEHIIDDEMLGRRQPLEFTLENLTKECTPSGLNNINDVLDSNAWVGFGV